MSDHATELVIKLMDSDSGTADDFVGEATYVLSSHPCLKFHNYYRYIKLSGIFSENICHEVTALTCGPCLYAILEIAVMVWTLKKNNAPIQLVLAGFLWKQFILKGAFHQQFIML